jgi:hypothetical protein
MSAFRAMSHPAWPCSELAAAFLELFSRTTITRVIAAYFGALSAHRCLGVPVIVIAVGAMDV